MGCVLSVCPSRLYELDDGIHPPYRLGERPRSYGPVPVRRWEGQESPQRPSAPGGGSYHRTRGNDSYRPSTDTRTSASHGPRMHSHRAPGSRARPSRRTTQSAMSGGRRETRHSSTRDGVGKSWHRRGTGPSTQGNFSTGGGWMRSGL